MERKTKTEYIGDSIEIEWPGVLHYDLQTLITQLQELLSEGATHVYIHHNHSDDYTISIDGFNEIPESDKEYESRLKKEEEALVERLRVRTLEEKALYEQLKAKFEL